MKYYWRYLKELRAGEHTLEAIYKRISGFTDEVLFEENDNMKIITTTYGKANCMVRRAACALAGTLPDGSAVALRLRNGAEWFVGFWAILMAGYIPLLENPELPAREYEGVMLSARVGEGGLLINELVERGAEDFEPRFADSIMVLTSGTTGEPKVCVYDGKAICAQILNAERIMHKDPEMRRFYKGELKILALLPFYHIFGLVANFLWFSFFGIPFVVPRTLSPDTIFATCRLHRATHIFFVPLLWDLVCAGVLREARDTGRADKLEKGVRISLSLQRLFPRFGRFVARRVLFKEPIDRTFGRSAVYCISGGGGIKPETLRILNAMGFYLHNGYGMSELGISSVDLRAGVKKRIEGSVGFPFESYEYRILNPDADGVGELAVRGASCAGEIIEGGVSSVRGADEWFATGDIFCRTATGYFARGRADDMINGANGERISPAEIENAFTLDHTKSMCVFGTDVGIVLIAEPLKTLSEYGRVRLLDDIKRINDLLPVSRRAMKIICTRTELPVYNAKVSRSRVKRMYADGAFKADEVDFSALPNAEEAYDESFVEILGRVIKCFASVLSISADTITPDSRFMENLGGTSLEYFALLEAVEKEFSVSLRINAETALVTPREFAQHLIKY